MKKIYLEPELEVVKIASHVSLLAGSDPDELLKDIEGETSTGWADGHEDTFDFGFDNEFDVSSVD